MIKYLKLSIICILIGFFFNKCVNNSISKEEFKNNKKKEYFRFFLTKDIHSTNNFRYVSFLFKDEIPVPYNPLEQLKFIAKQRKNTYRVLYNFKGELKSYEFFEKGELKTIAFFVYETINLSFRLKQIKYYSSYLTLMAIEKIIYNRFGHPKKTLRYLMPGYRRSNIY